VQLVAVSSANVPQSPEPNSNAERKDLAIARVLVCSYARMEATKISVAPKSKTNRLSGKSYDTTPNTSTRHVDTRHDNADTSLRKVESWSR
jgi:hypothetical protein